MALESCSKQGTSSLKMSMSQSPKPTNLQRVGCVQERSSEPQARPDSKDLHHEWVPWSPGSLPRCNSWREQASKEATIPPLRL